LVLREGGLVVIPTETVYGLAGSIWSEEALARIFEVKGRPTENPLIVHIADIADLARLCTSVSSSAMVLAEKFWPGPLTLVLPRRSEVSDQISAGGTTVAIRMPNHPVALALIRVAGVPVAAPSANRFMQLSPTAVEHLDPSIGDQARMVLDGGPCAVGIESTVVDCTAEAVRILRPGVLTAEEISRVVPCVIDEVSEIRKSPGMYLRHYSPRTPLRIVSSLSPNEGGVTLEEPTNEHQIRLPKEALGYASGLYSALHRLDQLGLSEIVVQSPPDKPGWVAIWDRLRKAANRDA
jgi:L-threonylcarbamoyladenylate synthase